MAIPQPIVTPDDLNALDREPAASEFLRCCGSTRWAREMADARPFSSVDIMTAAADRIWASLDPADWLEAFAAHPRIGVGGARQAGGAEAAGPEDDNAWATEEQSGVTRAADSVRQRLVEANRAYEVRFGYIFIVCATGKTGDDMLAILERRLLNAPHVELRIAAEEQRQITRLRLAKLLGSGRSRIE